MALKKSIDFKGRNAEYWMLSRTIPDKISNQTECVFSLYYSKTSRESDIHNVLTEHNETFEGYELTTEEIYTFAKSTLFFNGATDI